MLSNTRLAILCDMLTYCRPHGTGADDVFRSTFLHTLPGIAEDAHRNLIIRIGTAPVLWSSHTDTVHSTPGRQTLHVDQARTTITLSKRSREFSGCLGADDTVGVFLMREMILAGVEGLYIFHYGEESGCIGSGDLANFSPETLDGIQFAIALDRAGYTDIVTSQLGSQCCSETFARSLAPLLPGTFTGARGVYTDTAEYMKIIPECTNLSVGYFAQHTSRESVDYAHVGRLLDCLLVFDTSQLVCERDPFAPVFPHRSVSAPLMGAGTTRIDPGWSDYPWCVGCDCPIIPEEELYSTLWQPEHCECSHPILAGVTHDGVERDPDTQVCVSFFPSAKNAEMCCHCGWGPNEHDDDDLTRGLSRDEIASLTDEDRLFLRYLKGL